MLFDLVEKKYLTELKMCFHHLLRVSVAFTVKLLILPPPPSKKMSPPIDLDAKKRENIIETTQKVLEY